MNFVAIFFVQYLVQGPFQGATAAYNSSERIHATAELPVVLPGTRVHLGFVIALVAVLLTTLLFHRTTLGTEFRAAGFNARAAIFSGLSPRRLIVAAMGISGALAVSPELGRSSGCSSASSKGSRRTSGSRDWRWLSWLD
jgi:simple sugar transport system permease protein